MEQRCSLYQKSYADKVSIYKQKIDDFASIINSHKISSNVFSFIEEKTLPNVWFSSFNMAQGTNEMRVSGEAESLATLSRQVNFFEGSQDYIKGISVLSSQVDETGRVKFLINLLLNPKIFEYKK